MRKYPVVSSSGEKYLADAEYTEFMLGEALVIKLYKEVDCKFFWKNKTKLTKVYNLYFEKHESEYHDVVKAIEYTVSSYEAKTEKKIEQEMYQKELLERSARELKEWDGVCK